MATTGIGPTVHRLRPSRAAGTDRFRDVRTLADLVSIEEHTRRSRYSERRSLHGFFVQFVALAGFGGTAPIAADEEVVFFPTLGWPIEDGAAWQLVVHGWVFEPPSRSALTLRLLRRMLGIDKEELDRPASEIFAERGRAFLVDNERGKKLTIRIAGQSVRLETPSGANGHFIATVRLAAEVVAGAAHQPGGGVHRLRFEAVLEPLDRRVFAGEVFLLEDEGLSVISDIDDTIKLSDVGDHDALIRNTFLRPFEAVPGMAAVYERWGVEQKAAFHYVSGSFWQLYQPLRVFLRASGFPDGTYHLKNFRVKDRNAATLLKSQEAYKLGIIEPLLERFPRRRFVLVGDSGEQDPEIYGIVARKYPKQVLRILIRDVSGGSAADQRYRDAFAGVPDALWQVFRDPPELGPLPPAP